MPEIKVSKLKLHYEKIGRGEPLIILHGWGIDSTYFKKLADCLSPKFTVYTFDLPGFGGSDLPDKPWNVSNYADFLEHVIDHFKIKTFHLFGHSFGGRITIKYAIKNPEKLKGIILCASAGIKPSTTLKKIIFIIFAKVGNFIFKLPLLRNLKPFAKKMLYKAAREHDYEKLNNKIIQQIFKKVVQEDLRPYLPKIQVPTLLLWGTLDKLTPLKHGEIMNTEIKNSRLEIFENVGHKLPYALPEEVSRKICQFFKV